MGGAAIEQAHGAPAERLTAAQQRVLLTYARCDTIEEAAREIGISPQTVKNHLTTIYSVLGVRKAQQAVYVVMGGDNVASRLPPPRTDRQPPRPRVVVKPPARVATRLARFKEQARVLRAQNGRLARRVASLEAGHRPKQEITLPLDVPTMYDGSIRLSDLQRMARLLDSEGDPKESPRATLTEWIDALSYYVRARRY